MRSAHYFNDSVNCSMYWFIDEMKVLTSVCFTLKKPFICYVLDHKLSRTN